MKRLVDYDPLTRITTWFDYYPESDMTVVSREQDVEAILETNKALANNTDYTRIGFRNNWWHYATIPNILIEKWKNEEGINVFDKNDSKRVFKKLNQPEYKFLKVTDKVHL